MKKLPLLLVLISSVMVLRANNPSGLQIYGYLSHQVKLDTYRSLDTRDGELYFYPLRAKLDANGVDINKKPKLNMVEVQSRIGVRSTHEDFMGAKLTGVLEADFFGTSQQHVRMLRIRIAAINLKWQKHELLIGNHFHPSFVLECYPNTLSFAAAVPFHPLNRSPQIRYAFHPSESLNLSLSLLTHGYHRSAGPSEAQKNSGLPDVQFRLQYGDGKRQSMGLLAGYKFLTPRDETNLGLNTKQTVGSFNMQAFFKQLVGNFSFKTEVIYGENLTHFTMIGGYGAKGKPNEINLDGDYGYSNMRTVSTWIDAEASLGDFSTGLFLGYTANLGSANYYTPLPGYSRNDDLHYVFRASPRLNYSHKSLTFGLEWSVVGAAYGVAFDEKRKVTHTAKPTINNQFIISSMYKF
jgi:hypothetical protein